MAGKADFTEQEWDDLQEGVTGAGMLVSAAHRDFTDSFGEASFIAKQLAAHRTKREPAHPRPLLDPWHRLRLDCVPRRSHGGNHQGAWWCRRCTPREGAGRARGLSPPGARRCDCGGRGKGWRPGRRDRSDRTDQERARRLDRDIPRRPVMSEARTPEEEIVEKDLAYFRGGRPRRG